MALEVTALIHVLKQGTIIQLAFTALTTSGIKHKMPFKNEECGVGYAY